MNRTLIVTKAHVLALNNLAEYGGPGARRLAVGAGFEPAYGLFNSQLPYHLANPTKNWSERLESNQRPRVSETRALFQLSYAHKSLEQAAGIEPAFLR